MSSQGSAASGARASKRCGYEAWGLWAPLICGREESHTGTHIDFRSNVRVGFGPPNSRVSSQSDERASTSVSCVPGEPE